MTNFSMWGANMYLLIGLLLFLAAGAVVVVALWTGLKVWMWRIRQRRAWAEYRRQSQRADGRRYPPFTGGVCDHCKRVSKKVYHPASGPRLCSSCYEMFWRQAERSSPQEERAQQEAKLP